MALVAAHYLGNGKYAPRLPREAGRFKHQEIALNVSRWVEEALEPDSGGEMRTGATIEQILKYFKEQRLAPQFSGKVPLFDRNLKGEFDEVRWVCINHARLAAALFRQLGYCAQEVNVITGLKLPPRNPLANMVRRNRSKWKEYVVADIGVVPTYQTALVRIWIDGGWLNVDPYLHNENGVSMWLTVYALVKCDEALDKSHSYYQSIEQAEYVHYAIHVAHQEVVTFSTHDLTDGQIVDHRLVSPGWTELERGYFDPKKDNMVVEWRLDGETGTGLNVAPKRLWITPEGSPKFKVKPKE